MEMSREPCPELRCPVCRTPAEARIFSVDHSTFERQVFHSTAARGGTATPNATFPLTPQHIYRRQTYSESCPAAQTDVCCCRDSPASQAGHDRTAEAQPGSNHSELQVCPGAHATVRHHDDPTLIAWIKRELQALLLCDNPSTAQQVCALIHPETIHLVVQQTLVCEHKVGCTLMHRIYSRSEGL